MINHPRRAISRFISQTTSQFYFLRAQQAFVPRQTGTPSLPNRKNVRVKSRIAYHGEGSGRTGQMLILIRLLLSARFPYPRVRTPLHLFPSNSAQFLPLSRPFSRHFLTFEGAISQRKMSLFLKASSIYLSSSSSQRVSVQVARGLRLGYWVPP